MSGVTLLQLLAAVAVRVAPLRLVRSTAQRAAALIFVGDRNGEERVVWAIRATGRRLGRISSCLVQAVVAEAILSAAGSPVRFTIGIRRAGDGSLDAHAWIARDGQVLIGGSPNQYIELVEWNSPRA